MYDPRRYCVRHIPQLVELDIVGSRSDMKLHHAFVLWFLWQHLDDHNRKWSDFRDCVVDFKYFMTSFSAPDPISGVRRLFSHRPAIVRFLFTVAVGQVSANGDIEKSSPFTMRFIIRRRLARFGLDSARVCPGRIRCELFSIISTVAINSIGSSALESNISIAPQLPLKQERHNQ